MTLSNIIHTVKCYFYSDTQGITLKEAFHLDMNEDYSDIAHKAKAEAINEEIKHSIRYAKWYKVAGILLFLIFSLLSVTHMYHILASIKPDTVAAVVLPKELITVTSFLFALIFDVIVFYLTVYVNPTANKAKTTVVNVNLFYWLLALLNGLYIVSYFPNVHEGVRSFIVSAMTYITVPLLVTVFILTLVKLKTALSTLSAAIISLKVEHARITAMLNEASQSVERTPNEKDYKTIEDDMIKRLLASGVPAYKVAKSMQGTYKKNLERVNALAETPQNEDELSSIE